MCAPSASAPLQKAMSVSNYPPYPCVLLSFCLPLACGIVGCALTWHVRAVTCARPHLCAPSLGMCAPSLGMCVLLSFCLPLACGIVGCALTCVCPHLACARPHLARARRHLCAPSIGTCAPSPVRALTWNVRDLTCARPHLACARPHLVCGRTLTWHVRALTWHVCALTWHVRALCVRPSPKSNVGVQLPPYPCVLLSFCLPLACGIVGCALTWHVRAVTCARPRLACARPHLACARPLRPPLSKKQCRCPTTPLIRAYCCLFAFRYLVG